MKNARAELAQAFEIVCFTSRMDARLRGHDDEPKPVVPAQAGTC
jgi:hypothetical protein